MLFDNTDTDLGLEVFDTCVRDFLLSWVECSNARCSAGTPQFVVGVDVSLTSDDVGRRRRRFQESTSWLDRVSDLSRDTWRPKDAALSSHVLLPVPIDALSSDPDGRQLSLVSSALRRSTGRMLPSAHWLPHQTVLRSKRSGVRYFRVGLNYAGWDP